MVRIAGIESGSVAQELRLEIGTRIVRVNGQRVRDGIDLAFLLADPELAVETISPAGERVVYEIERDPETPLGLVPAPDKIRECANKCVFCFIDGNPKDARDSLWLRDDDFRLSFAYGSYVTLTNLGPRGLQRLVDQRISPLYVSVHATEPEVRERMLANRRAGLVMEQLSFLLAEGLEVHAQVVLCPEWNDGAHLDRTVDDLWSLGPGVRSLSVVPVGLTKYNENRPVRRLAPSEAAAAVGQVARARARAAGERETRWAYAADEMFLIAGMEVPDASYYDDPSLAENGVGAVRRFLDDLDAGVDALPVLPGRRVRVATGRSMAPWIEARAERLEAATRAEVEVLAVTNRYFGSGVTVAGLLAGRDVRAALGEGRREDVVLLPAGALNADGVFVDDYPLTRLRRELAPARVVVGHEISRMLSEP